MASLKKYPVSAARSETDGASQFEKALLGLRSLVLSGKYAAGERLPEISVSERLGISRTPLRQAMDRLVEEKLLERIATGGCRVASLSMEDIIDALEIRGVIEGTAARLAAERGAVPELVGECSEVLNRLDEVLASGDELDFEAYRDLNAQFHSLLARLAGSAFIERELRRASTLPLASPSAFLLGQETVPAFAKSLQLAQAQHRAIFEAILEREGARAEALAREHARLARRNLDFVLQSKHSLEKLVPGLALVSTEPETKKRNAHA